MAVVCQGVKQRDVVKGERQWTTKKKKNKSFHFCCWSPLTVCSAGRLIEIQALAFSGKKKEKRNQQTNCVFQPAARLPSAQREVRSCSLGVQLT